MIPSFIIAAASAAVLSLSATAFAQQADHGTADEAKAMLTKAVAALKQTRRKRWT
jgi:predicted outer membrane protein